MPFVFGPMPSALSAAILLFKNEGLDAKINVVHFSLADCSSCLNLQIKIARYSFNRFTAILLK